MAHGGRLGGFLETGLRASERGVWWHMWLRNGWVLLAFYVVLWVWVCSPWLRYFVLPGLTPYEGSKPWVWPWRRTW